MATSGRGEFTPGIELSCIKQEITEDEEELAQTSSQPSEPSRLSDLLVRIEVRESILKQAWSSLTQALGEYKTELKLVSEDNDDTIEPNRATSNPDRSLPGVSENSERRQGADCDTDTSLDHDGVSDRTNVTADKPTEEAVVAPTRPPEHDSVQKNFPSITHDSKNMIKEYCVMQSLNQHLDRQLKDCRSELKEKHLDLMSKVVQLGLVEAKLSDSKKRCALLSHHVKSLITRPSSDPTPTDTSAANERAADMNTAYNTLHDQTSIASGASIPLSVERLDSSNLFGMLQPVSDSGSATVMSTYPRKRGRPPGRGRGSGRGPLTVSMMMRGMGQRQYRGRPVAGATVTYKPRYISEMIAAVEGTPQSPPLPGIRIRGPRSRGTNIPIRTLLHMNALGLDISDQATSTMDVSDRVNTLPPDTCTDQESETSNGHVDEEGKMDPFSDLYIDPANIKTEPVEPVPDTDTGMDTRAMQDTDTSMDTAHDTGNTIEEKSVRRSARASKRKIDHWD